MRKRPQAFVSLLSLSVLVAAGSLWAATQNALVTGSVYDQGGNPIPGATVRLINANTGFSRTLSTDASGAYTFNNVPPAENYVFSVEASGYATVIRPGISIKVGEAKLVLPPFRLQPTTQPGQEITEAPAEAPLVSPELVSTTLSGLIEAREMRTLPLVNRDFIDLTLLVPGTYPVEQGSQLEGASLVVNGARATMNNFLLDGADNNDYTINQSLPFQLVEALQEFRVQTSTSRAEFGRNAGAQINELTRSGSNTLHGTLFWFFRDNAFGANNAISAHRGGTFDEYAQSVRLDQIRFGSTTFFPNGGPLQDPVLRDLFDEGRDQDITQHIFGANLGGPIKKDKVFFFFNWESVRADFRRPLFERVPGSFWRDPSFAVDESTRRTNQILNFYPVAAVPESTVLDAFGFPVVDPIFGPAFAVSDPENSSDNDNFLFRIDTPVSNDVTLSWKYNIQDIRQDQHGRVPPSAAYPGSGIEIDGRNQNFSFNYLHQVSPRTTNEFRFGWNRFRLDSLPFDHTLSPASFLDNVNFTDRGLPTILVGGSFTFGPDSSLGAPLDSPSNRANNVWQFADNVSFVLGRHTLKVGAEVRHVRLNITNEALGRGVLSFFSNPFAANSGEPDLASIAAMDNDFSSGANEIAAFIPGGGFDRSFSANSFNWFIQDTWRARSNLTLTFGLRHEINQAPRESRDRLVNHFPETNCGSFVCLMQANTRTILSPFLGPPGDNIVSLGEADFVAPDAGFDTDFDNFGPHVGFAWDPWDTGRTVIRGAYGIFYNQQSFQASVNMLHNPPFVQQVFSFFPVVELGDTFAPQTGFFSFGGPSLNVFDLDGNGNSSLWFRGPFSITTIDPDRRTSYVHQWNLGVQRQLGNHSLVEIGYVGSAGHKLPQSRLILGCDQEAFAPDNGSNCFFNFIGFGGFGATPNPELSLVRVNQQNSANSSYHSLQLRFDTRQFHGLTLRLHYQWAKSIDNASSLNGPTILFPPASGNFLCAQFFINCDQFSAINTLSNQALSLRPGLPLITTRPLFPQDGSNLAGERAVSDFDIRHRFIIRYMYNVPKFAPGIGDGWQLAGITTIQSGQPYSVFTDFFGLPLRPNIVSPVSTTNDTGNDAIDGALPVGCNIFFTCSGTSATSAFDPSINAFFQPGLQGRNSFTGPGMVNFDFSILKNTYLGAGERANIQFRVEFFNLFNNANFRQPYSLAGQYAASTSGFFTRQAFPDPFFGQILQARPGREIQFGLKFIF